MQHIIYDVVVVGSGLAGTMAALTAAETGASVALVSLGPIFSGSSFYPGTWGLGCVGPENVEDEDEFIATILRVGQQIPDPALVAHLVHETPLVLADLERRGVQLKYPEHAQEQEFIPCFDHKHRTWRGIERTPYETTIGHLLRENNVALYPGLEVLELLTCPSGPCSPDEAPYIGAHANAEHTATQNHATSVCGVCCFDHNDESLTAGELVYFFAKSVLLATGGSGGLFARYLTGQDVIGSAQGMAASVGATLTNIEFIQIMPGLIGTGEGIVFNEKIFRHLELTDANNESVLPPEIEQAVLRARSGHGPFTTDRISREVDFALARAKDAGLRARYAPHQAHDSLPEFVRVYFSWLQQKTGIGLTDEMRIAPYAHAANGGISIDENGFTGINGLYACGECSGGVHGADRIGGLASASALVFGTRAGRAAALHASQQPTINASTVAQACSQPAKDALTGIDAETASRLTARMQKTMSANCLILRSERSLHEATQELKSCAAELALHVTPTTDAASYARAMRLRYQISHAQAIIDAAAKRTSSLGSHCYTEDESHANTTESKERE